VPLPRRLLDEGQVQVPGLDPALEHGALGHGQVQVHPRVLLAEVAQDAGHRGQGQVVGDPEPEPAGQPGAGEVTHRLLVRGQDLTGESGHGLAVHGQRDAAGVPDEQRPPHGVLQLADVLTDRGLPETQAGRGPREAERLGHRQKGAQQFRVVHHVAFHCKSQ
jgi:hypothetical protein